MGVDLPRKLFPLALPPLAARQECRTLPALH
jgi:hypothetical protein